MTNGVLEDLLPDLYQGTTELLDSLRINLAAPDGPIHNVPEELPAYSSHMRSGSVVDQVEPRDMPPQTIDHQNWQLRHWHPVLFTNESRFNLSTCDNVKGSGDAVENVMLPSTSFSMTGLVSLVAGRCWSHCSGTEAVLQDCRELGNRSSPPGLQRAREQKQSSRTAESSGTEAVLQDCRELGNRSSPPGLQRAREQKQSSRTAESSGTEAVLQDCRELGNRSSPPGLQRARKQKQSSRTAESSEQKQSSRTAESSGTGSALLRASNRHEDLKHAGKKDQAKPQTNTLALTGRRTHLK
ncbi:hypothetical protein D4764_09G0009450 [Takifugu flavidus]|uniref:Uncharacterized protein n=1 Tax=Takifugu flavidus TaxID=433684 RepID=A0A5C6MMH7_9TELE|nr:hypothetical protein D4764_09G0009450 [Takifugu flavidus]